mmetsp:Transcript_3447/g.10036  ORF Transcript_3447/g.10036 Transcript_3447/m.10036 type:complete len:289 (+) Transcript_3447:1468-2334(+)
MRRPPGLPSSSMTRPSRTKSESTSRPLSCTRPQKGSAWCGCTISASSPRPHSQSSSASRTWIALWLRTSATRAGSSCPRASRKCGSTPRTSAWRRSTSTESTAPSPPLRASSFCRSPSSSCLCSPWELSRAPSYGRTLRMRRGAPPRRTRGPTSGPLLSSCWTRSPRATSIDSCSRGSSTWATFARPPVRPVALGPWSPEARSTPPCPRSSPSPRSTCLMSTAYSWTATCASTCGSAARSPGRCSWTSLAWKMPATSTPCNFPTAAIWPTRSASSSRNCGMVCPSMRR